MKSNNICGIEDCSRKHYARNWCSMHYQRWLNNGDPLISQTKYHGKTGTPTHNTWHMMRQRCLNKNHKHYKHYGGRGIKICERWLNSFESFLSDMGFRPNGKTLDRIDNNGHYEPDNCRWATKKQQMRNARTNRIIEYEGLKMPLSAWAEKVGIDYKVVCKRIEVNPNATFKELFRPIKKINRILTHNGKTKRITSWSRELGIPYQTLCSRIQSHPNWPPEKLLDKRHYKKWK